MKLICKTLVMLCVFILGYTIINGEKVLAEESNNKYKIEINGQIVTRINEEPDYAKYITIKDNEGNIVNDVIWFIGEGVLKLDTPDSYPIIVYAYIKEIDDYEVIKTRVKVVKDKPPKIIDLYKKHYFDSTTISEENILKGVKVTDDFIDNPKVYVKDYNNIEWKIGENIVTIVAEDDNGLDSEIDIVVMYYDKLPTIIKNDYIEVEVFEEIDLLKYLEIDDFYIDGIKLDIVTEFSNDNLGEKTVKIVSSFYNIIKEIDVNVKVVDTKKPSITGEKTIRIKKGETIDLRKSFTVNDNYDDYKDLKIYILGHYDNKKPGKYNLTLLVKDLSDNTSYYYFTLIVERKTNALVWVILISSIVILGTCGTYYYLKKYSKNTNYTLR